jgi:hypothetical protein
MMEDWPNGPWWKKLLGTVGLLTCILLLLATGGVVDVGANYFDGLSRTHRWLAHIPAITFILIYSFIGTCVVIAIYEGIYRANPLPMQMHPEDLAAFEADREKRRSRALLKTCSVVFVAVLGLYVLRSLR